MPNCFNRAERIPPISRSGVANTLIDTSFSKDVEEDGIVKKVTTFEKVSLVVYAAKSDIPESDNYKLSEMIKQGYTPNEVRINGLFDSSDALDSVNQKLINDFSAAMENTHDAVSE